MCIRDRGIHNFNRNSKWLWVLDPLDGTKDFIQGTGNYAMHLALNYEEKSYIGIVLIPEKNELWISDGKNAWSESRDGYKNQIKVKNNKTLQEMTLVTSKNHRNEILENLIDKVNFKQVSVTLGEDIISAVGQEYINALDNLENDFDYTPL